MRARGVMGIGLLLASCSGGGGATGGTGTAVAVVSTPAPTPTPTPLPVPSPSPTPTPTPTPPPSTASLNVAFIGGSITEGTGATAPNRSYAALLTAWLGTHYDHVEARNLGVGGTGSEFGAYRIDHDLAGFVPDLAFLEFTVNDAGESRETIFADLDAIIHKLRQKNPRVRIVYLSSTDASEEALRRAGQRAAYIEIPAAATAFEGLTFIDLGTGLWAKVIAGAPVSTYLTDAVHPTDAGHELYFEEVRAVLDPLMPLPVLDAVAGGKLIAQSRLDTARLEPARSATGCRAGTLALKYMDSALQCGADDSFTFRFTGTTLGMIRAIVRDGGRLDCTVDGHDQDPMDFFDSYALSYDRSLGTILYRGLTPGDHLLACTVDPSLVTVAGGSSTGHMATIGAFLVSDERPVVLP